MPIRKFNFTNRIRIGRDCISIQLENERTSQYEFRAKLNLNNLDFPKDSEVFLEAYYQTEKKRFSFGSLGQLSQPSDRSLAEFASFANVNFRLLVVSPGEHNRSILGVADRLTPEYGVNGRTQGNGKLSILPVETSDEMSEAWRLDFSTDEPVLILNSRLFDIKQKLDTDPIFKLLILPQVIRFIVYRMIYIEHAQIDDEDSAYSNWFKFLLKQLKKGVKIPSTDVDSVDFDEELLDKWTNDVIDNFCDSLKLLENVNSVVLEVKK
jgi:hypothetical protein